MPEQIALIEVPVRDISDRRSHRLVATLGELEVLGQRCQVMTTGQHLEFWVARRRFEVSLEDLAATVAAAITGHLKGEIIARVTGAPYDGQSKPLARAARDAGRDIPIHRTVEPLP